MPRTRKPPLPGRKLLPQQVNIGDLIRITTRVDDLQISNVGKVAKREYMGAHGIIFYTAQGHMIGTVYSADQNSTIRFIKTGYTDTELEIPE